MDFDSIIGGDTETTLMSAQAIIPQLVCISVDAGSGFEVLSARDNQCRDYVAYLLDPDSLPVCFHNASFDLTVLYRAYPEFKDNLFKSLDSGRFHCTIIREKMLQLADHGKIDYKPLFPGSDAWKSAQYTLDALTKERFNIDISAGKKGADAWRLNFEALMDIPVSEWPLDAVNYAGEDATHCRNLFKDQTQRAATLSAELGVEDVLQSSSLRVAVDFSLQLATAWGMAVRQKPLVEVSAEVAADRDPLRKDEDGELHWKYLFTTKVWDNLQSTTYPVFDGDEKVEEKQASTHLPIINLPVPPQPFANGAKDHLEDCPGHKDHPRYKKGAKVECLCPVKMTKAKKESRNAKALQEYVQCLALQNDDITVVRNEPTDKMRAKGITQGNISLDRDWMEEYADFDPALKQYNERSKLDKLVTSYLPKFWKKDDEGNQLDVAVDRIHFPFDILKMTGRTSSRESKLYPSMNGQQMDPRVRKILGGDGLLCSWDFKAMELCTVAQRCLDVFGESVMANLINAGKDLHCYLGGGIAGRFDEGFKSDYATYLDSPLKLYEEFMKLAHDDSVCPYPWAEDKKEGKNTMAQFFKHFRTFAKPTNLGYPGGLSHKTFVAYALGTYGVRVNEDQAKELKQAWMDTYPEVPAYHKYMTQNMVDMRCGKVRKENADGSVRYSDRYWYQTPFGLVRSSADYCAAANGSAMQSPSAEGATLSFYEVTKALHGSEFDEVLAPDERGFKARMCNFIHDELLAYVREDSPEEVTRVVDRISRIMEQTFQAVTPDVKSVAEPALMRRCWIKAAEEERDHNGNIVPWDDIPENYEKAKEWGVV